MRMLILAAVLGTTVFAQQSDEKVYKVGDPGVITPYYARGKAALHRRCDATKGLGQGRAGRGRENRRGRAG